MRIHPQRHRKHDDLHHQLGPDHAVQADGQIHEDQQRDVFDAIAPEFQAFPGDRSREAQAMLIHGLLSSKDRFNLFRGVAGAGRAW